MTLEKFSSLTKEEQLRLLAKEGVFVGKRTDRPLLSLLYQLDSFYIEIIYREYRRLISMIRCTNCVSILDPYLNQLDVGILVI